MIAGGGASPFRQAAARSTPPEAHAKLRPRQLSSWRDSRKRARTSTSARAKTRTIPISTSTSVLSSITPATLAAAIDHLERAVALNPEYAEAMCLLGLAQHDAGFFDNAGRTFDRALALVRKTRNPLSRILVEKLDSRHFELPPIRELRAAVQDGDVLCRAPCAMPPRQFNAGDYARAVSAFRDAVTMHPGYADLQRAGCGKCAARELGDPEASDPGVPRALDINPAPTVKRVTAWASRSSPRRRVRAHSAQELDRVAHSHPTYADVRAQARARSSRAGRFRFRTGEHPSAAVTLWAPRFGARPLPPGLPRAARWGIRRCGARASHRRRASPGHVSPRRLELGVQALNDRRNEEAVQTISKPCWRRCRNTPTRCLLGTALLELNAMRRPGAASRRPCA